MVPRAELQYVAYRFGCAERRARQRQPGKGYLNTPSTGLVSQAVAGALAVEQCLDFFTT
jgi:hypothetical protein